MIRSYTLDTEHGTLRLSYTHKKEAESAIAPDVVDASTHTERHTKTAATVAVVVVIVVVVWQRLLGTLLYFHLFYEHNEKETKNYNNNSKINRSRRCQWSQRWSDRVEKMVWKLWRKKKQ